MKTSTRLNTEPSSIACPPLLAGPRGPSYTWLGTITRSRSSTSPWKAPPSYTSFPAAAARSPAPGPLTVAGSRRGYRDTYASTSGPAAGSSSACSPSARRRRLRRISVGGWRRAASRVSIGHASLEKPGVDKTLHGWMRPSTVGLDPPPLDKTLHSVVGSYFDPEAPE